MGFLKTTVLAFGLVAYATATFVGIQYPNLIQTTDPPGNITLLAGPQGGDIFIYPGATGSVFILNTDLIELFKIVNSLPPIWSDKSPHGSLGIFLGGSRIQITLGAEDPDGGSIQFKKVSGAFPPGVTLNSATGVISGIAPDIDAEYEFGIRAVDLQGQHADQIFSIGTREKNHCLSNPCRNGARCEDEIDDYRCICSYGYGGKNCQLNCANTAVGVDQNIKRIPDAQLAGHFAVNNQLASSSRLNHNLGWLGYSDDSWLQVDLGTAENVHAVGAQGLPANPQNYIITYILSYSTDGNNFFNVTSGGSVNPTVFTRNVTDLNAVVKQSLPSPVKARFVRFIPRTFNTRPGMRVEIYACPLE